MIRSRKSVGLFFAAMVFLAGSCSMTPVSTGGGTDFPNTRTVAGVLVSAAGAPVDSGRVLLVRDISGPHDPVPRFLFDTTWSSHSGRFVFEGVSAGSYAVEARSRDGSQIAYVGAVTATDQEVSLDTIPLRKSGSLRGTVVVRPGLRVVIAITSTHYLVTPDSLGRFEFPVLPQGDWDLTIIVLDSAGLAREHDTTLVGQTVSDSTVLPGSIDLPAVFSSKFARKLVLNTTVSGAGIMEDILDFPIAVRLDSTRMDFSSARPDGGDIRFLRPDGGMLPHRIELWDSRTRSAVVWVRIDTIFGNRRQPIYMVWGDTLSASRGAVFDSVNGFRGVWHLTEQVSGTGTLSAFKDASVFASHGNDFVASDGKEGILGWGQEFSGVGDYIEIVPAVQPLGEMTVSLWLKPEFVHTDNKGFRLVSTHKEPWDTLYGFLLHAFNNDFSFAPSNGTTPNSAGSWDMVVAAWTHLAVTFVNGTGETEFFVNGEKKTDDGYAGPVLAYTAGVRTIFGGGPAGAFKGNLDEIRIEHVRRSASWIRLCYENQKIRQTLVEF